MSKECPTCHRPFEKRGMHCASCGRPIKKNHKWRIDHSTVRHQDCRNVRLVPLCQSRFNTQECVLELENHPRHHISAHGVTWSLDEHEFDSEGDVISNIPLLPAGGVGRTLLFGGIRGGGMTAMALDGLCTTGGYAGVVRADHAAIDTAENEGMILRERGE